MIYKQCLELVNVTVYKLRVLVLLTRLPCVAGSALLRVSGVGATAAGLSDVRYFLPACTRYTACQHNAGHHKVRYLPE